MEAQVVVVTGCSSGIGRATALEAARRGHRVFATARRREDLDDLARTDRIIPLRLDVTNAATIMAAVESVLAQTGRLDTLVNNAGFGQYGAVEDVSPEQWRRQFDVNFFGAIETIRAALPSMRRARRGTIVNVSSVAGQLGIPFAAPYCASKHALEALSDALRVELAPFGIRVVIVEAGPILTSFEERARADVADVMARPGPYSAFYPAAERAMATDFRKGQLPPEAVASVILDAIESSNPRTRYRVGSMAKVLLPLRRLLPDRFFDRRMKKLLRLPKRA